MEVSEVRLRVNDNEIPPDLPNDPRLKVISGLEDVTDVGKFLEIRDHQGYVLTTDDDIEYPPDYVEKMTSYVDRFSKKAMIGVHGAVLPFGPPIQRFSHYSGMRRTLVFQQEMASFSPINVIGTGTLAFHTSIGVPDAEKFDYMKMVDLHIAQWAQNKSIPMFSCPRKRGWLKDILTDYKGRIYSDVRRSRDLQNQMLEVIARAETWTNHSQSFRGQISGTSVFKEFTDWPNRELPPGMKINIEERNWENLGEFPKVSIYVPAFNAENFIIECLDSALAQTYPNFDICVHNDGSTDNTLQKIKKKYGKNKRIKISSGINGGIGYASNQAINNCDGELILQLDSDDVLHQDALSELVAEFSNEVVCTYGNFNRINTKGEKIDNGWEWPDYNFPRLMKSMIIHPPRLFRRSAWEHVGGHNENLTNAVDYDFFIRIGEIGEMRHLRKTLYSYRIHEDSTSKSRTEVQTQNTNKVQKEMLERISNGNYTTWAPSPDNPRRIEYIRKSIMG